MDKYVTGATIKRLREERKMTQAALAERLCVTEKAVSKWETGRGYPDITLIEPIAAALGVSVIELLSGNDIINSNRAFNMAKTKIYVCPICGNVIFSGGEAMICCCGVTLTPCDIEQDDTEHAITVELSEDEFYVTLVHSMTKEHYISFLAAVTDNGFTVVKQYPEGNCEARFKTSRTNAIYAFCNRHGLFRVRVNARLMRKKRLEG